VLRCLLCVLWAVTGNLLDLEYGTIRTHRLTAGHVQMMGETAQTEGK